MRLRYMFWLDLDKEIEYEIAEEIETLKEKRSFVSTIRDGIRLILDLRRGKTDVLNALFPWVLEHAQAQIQTDDAPIPTPEAAFQSYFERMAQRYLEQGAIPVTQGKPSEAPVPKHIAADDLDDDSPIEMQRISNTSSRDNPVLNCMLSSARMNNQLNAVPLHYLNYGLDTGHISRSDLLPETLAKLDFQAQHTVAMTPMNPTGGIKKMAVSTALPPPIFDDDDDEPIDLL